MPGTAAELPPGPRRALVIANSDYADESLARLRAPARDATGLAAVLADPGIGGFEVTSLIDLPSQEIRMGAEDFLSARETEDLVVVYLSCHGVRDKRGRLYFAAADTRKTLLASTGVEAGWLMYQFEECRARQQVLILDCCFSGAFAAGAKGETDLELERHLATHGRGRAVLTASRAGEYSFEGEALPGRQHAGSIFTAGLIEGLTTGSADADEDGLISVEDAYDHAYGYVRRAGGNQTPQRWAYGAEGRIWLARSPRGKKVTPAALPEALRMALDSPLPEVRLGAVEVLGQWLTRADAGRVAAARLELGQVAGHDIPRVADAARKLLDAGRLADAATTPVVDSPARKPPDPRGPLADLRGPLAGLLTGPARATESPAPVKGASQPRTSSARIQRPRLARTLTGHSDIVLDVAFSPGGELLASASLDHTVILWDPVTAELRHTIAKHHKPVRSVAFGPGGAVLATASDDAYVHFWDPYTAQRKPAHAITIFSNFARAVAFSPDGKTLATGDDNKTARLWAPTNFKSKKHTLTGHTDTVNAVAFSPDGKTLATGSDDHTVRIWDASTGVHRRTLNGHSGPVVRLAFSPDGSMIATASLDGTVRIWNPASTELLHTLGEHSGEEVIAVAFSPDGRTLSTAGGDCTINLWDSASWELLHTLDEHTETVWAVAFSPDGQTLASAGADHTVRLWQLPGET